MHFYKTTRVLPTGQRARCEVCRSEGKRKLAYHRTTVRSFKKMVDDQHINPLVCQARVLSFSRTRNQGFGGHVLLVVPEGALSGKKEMCYVHPDDHRKLRDAEKIMQVVHRREGTEAAEAVEEIPVTRLHAYLGLTQYGFRKECEVMANGCLPLSRVLKVEYWIETSCDDRDPIMEIRENTLLEITTTKSLAKKIGKPFEVKSCTPAVSWYKTGVHYWGHLDHKNLDLLSNGIMPEPEGVKGMYSWLDFKRAIPNLKCKCLPTPVTTFKELRGRGF